MIRIDQIINAQNLISSTLGYFFNKENAIYKDTKEVLAGMPPYSTSILSCSVIDDSKLCEHPVESGSIIVDHKIFNPIEIDIKLSIPSVEFYDIYSELEKIYKNSDKLRIKCKNTYYSNMVLQAIPHEENPEMYDRIVFDLHFKEIVEVVPQFIQLPISKVLNPENSDTQKLGDNLTSSAKKTSILKDAFNKFF